MAVFSGRLPIRLQSRSGELSLSAGAITIGSPLIAFRGRDF